MMQTKIAFKVAEINRRDSNRQVQPEQKSEDSKIEETKQQEEEPEEEEQADTEQEQQQDVNPFFHEPLYIGNLCTAASDDRYYRWILFISSSPTEIVKPKSVSSVTYTLHPTYPQPKRTKKKSPFFLDITGWGIFQLDIEIRFKNNFIRPTIDTAHMLSVDSPTTVTCLDDGTRTFHNKLFEYRHFPQFRNEAVLKKASFVKKASSRLKRNLLRTPAPVFFDHFNGTLDSFLNTMKTCVSTHSELAYIQQLSIPDSIFQIIGHFAVFSMSLYQILPNQEVVVEDSKHSEIVISAPKFNHLRLTRCSNIHVKFPYIMSKLELIDCDNIHIVCTGLCYTYRMDGCNNINIQFLDPGSRVTLLCFDTPVVTLNCVGIQWQEPRAARNTGNVDEDKEQEEEDMSKYEDKEKYPNSLSYQVPYEQGEKEKLSVRWRGTVDKVPGYTWKIFHAGQTLGSMARRQ